MEKTLLFLCIFIISVSTMFAERETGIDLLDMFEGNQAGFGYDGGQFDTSLYVDAGTESLRFTVNILDLGGSFFNNAALQSNTTTPVLRGIPRFFVGAGYDFGYHIISLGYGLSKIWNSTNENKPGWMAHDVSIAYQGYIGDYILKIAAPVQIGFGTGEYDGGYDLTKVRALSVAPEFRFAGDGMYPLSEIRLVIPFGMSSATGRKFPDRDIGSMTVGADLRMYFNLSYDPVTINIVPRVTFKMALDGNKLETLVMGQRPEDILNDTYKFNDYTLENPMNLRMDIQLEMSGTDDNLVSLWAGPIIRLEVFLAKSIVFYKDNSGSVSPPKTYNRDDNYIMGLGFELPIELTIKPLENLHLKIGMLATGNIFDGDNIGSLLKASIDGGVILYF